MPRRGPFDVVPGRIAPWRPRDLLILAMTTSLGVALVAVGWTGASGETQFGNQLGWLNIAVIGSVLAAAGNVVFLATGFRTYNGLRRRLFPATAQSLYDLRIPGLELSNGATDCDSGKGTQDAGQMVGIKGMTMYHQRACPLILRKPMESIVLCDPESADRKPCGVCQPMRNLSAVEASVAS